MRASSFPSSSVSPTLGHKQRAGFVDTTGAYETDGEHRRCAEAPGRSCSRSSSSSARRKWPNGSSAYPSRTSRSTWRVSARAIRTSSPSSSASSTASRAVTSASPQPVLRTLPHVVSKQRLHAGADRARLGSACSMSARRRSPPSSRLRDLGEQRERIRSDRPRREARSDRSSSSRRARPLPPDVQVGRGGIDGSRVARASTSSAGRCAIAASSSSAAVPGAPRASAAAAAASSVGNDVGIGIRGGSREMARAFLEIRDETSARRLVGLSSIDLRDAASYTADPKSGCANVTSPPRREHDAAADGRLEQRLGVRQRAPRRACRSVGCDDDDASRSARLVRSGRTVSLSPRA